MKSLFEQNGGTYTKVGDYYIPDVTVPDTKEYNIGKYGRLHRKFLKENYPAYYSTLLMTGKLLEHLEIVTGSPNVLWYARTRRSAPAFDEL